MSTETNAYTPASFPALRDRRTEDVEARARVRGHAAGYSAGLAAAARQAQQDRSALVAEHEAASRAARARLDRALTVLAAATTALNQRVVPGVTEAHDTLAHSAVDLAEAILGHELAQRPDSARSAVHRALSAVEPVAVRSVRLNPEDLAALDEVDTAAAGVRFTTDPSLQPGDAVVDLDEGFLDARISTALARARAALEGGGPA